MGMDSLRRVVGYNTFYAPTFANAIAAGGYVDLTCATGPGEFLGFIIAHWGGTLADLNQLNFRLTVDGYAAYNATLRDWIGVDLTATGTGLFGTNFVIGTGARGSSKPPVVPYASSCVLRFANPTANSVSEAITYLHRAYR